MAINAVSLLGGLMPQTVAPAASAAGGGASFGNLVGQALTNVANRQAEADTAVNEMALGQNDNIHGVLLQVAQADLSIRLVLEIRNRLSDAYQEIMKMQV